MILGAGLSQMFAPAKLAEAVTRVKPEALRQRETKSGGSEPSNFRRWAERRSCTSDLNYFNRPVRTRMPGGVGGVRSAMSAPYPDFWGPGSASADYGRVRRSGDL